MLMINADRSCWLGLTLWLRGTSKQVLLSCAKLTMAQLGNLYTRKIIRDPSYCVLSYN